jgi:hypothetical protein
MADKRIPNLFRCVSSTKGLTWSQPPFQLRLQFTTRVDAGSTLIARPIRNMSISYKDKLVEITDQEVVFHRYYFPFGTAKRVPLSQIETVQARRPSVASGSWRIWGTGDFATWFPLDFGRPNRDTIFVASLRGASQRIGFTVEDSQKVAEVLKERGLLYVPSA